MDIKKTSLTIVGFLWLIVGICLAFTGSYWILKLKLGTKMILFFLAGIVIGLLKGVFILKKVALKYLKSSENIEFTKIDKLTGPLKILGIKGIVLIGAMIAIGVFLRHSNIDRPILGIVYLAVGIALVYASKIFFNNKNSQKMRT